MKTGKTGCCSVKPSLFICGANQEVPVPVCLPVSLSQIFSSETKLYSPNLCLGKSIVGHVVVWFVCQFFLSWSGIPHSFHKILLLWWKTTGLAPHIKCQPVCLSMGFILRKFYYQSRHFFLTIVFSEETEVNFTFEH